MKGADYDRNLDCRGDFDEVNHPKTAEDDSITYSGMGMCGSAPLQNPGKYKGKRTRLKAISEQATPLCVKQSCSEN